MTRNILVIVGVVIALLALGQFAPLIWDSNYYCPYCRARLHRNGVFIIPLSSKIEVGPMARYWITSVDTCHQHTWRFSYSGQRYTLNESCTDGPDHVFPTMLPEAAETKILRSIPSPAKRKALVEKLWNASSGNAMDYAKLKCFVFDVRAAYLDNPNRTDWPKILKKHGYSP